MKLASHNFTYKNTIKNTTLTLLINWYQKILVKRSQIKHNAKKMVAYLTAFIFIPCYLSYINAMIIYLFVYISVYINTGYGLQIDLMMLRSPTHTNNLKNDLLDKFEPGSHILKENFLTITVQPNRSDSCQIMHLLP